MIGVYDFCGHYEWTFEWLYRLGGDDLLREYWDQAIYRDSQTHARELIQPRGFEGMEEYWGHTLVEEGAGYSTTRTGDAFRIDMHACPSKGFLIRNNLQQHHDYCDHCMGWCGPLLSEAGFTVHHEHDHRGRCWWEIRRFEDTTPPSEPGDVAGDQDVRRSAEWAPEGAMIDRYVRGEPE
jgi:hypothetical protein